MRLQISPRDSLRRVLQSDKLLKQCHFLERNCLRSSNSKFQPSLKGNNIELTGHWNSFFKFYHPLCPLLNPEIGSQEYFNLSPVLGWTVILVAARRYSTDPQLLNRLLAPYQRLLWVTIQEMPQRYHSVKALALLCTWPVVQEFAPQRTGVENTKGTGLGLSEVDPTFMLSGIMVQIALQTGLHRPPHVQDFTKSARFMSQEEIDDRQLTWVVCNIVAQRFVMTFSDRYCVSTKNLKCDNYDWPSLTFDIRLGL
jgi:hypothetical protein